MVFYTDYKYSPNIVGLRHSCIGGSKPLKLYGNLNHNGFTTSRYLLPTVTADIVLQRNPPEFCLIRNKDIEDEYKVVISDCNLFVKHVVFHEDAMEQVQKALIGRVARYPYTKMSMVQFDIPAGATMWRSNPFFAGPKPKQVYFAICDRDSLQGRNWENNPMIFPASHYGVNYVQFYSGDNDKIMHQPYKPDFENENIGREYYELLRQATENFKKRETIMLSSDDFAGQYGIFALQSMPDYGDLQVEVGFKKPTPCQLAAVIFIHEDSDFTIDGPSGVYSY
jgi:hypothetical protein